MIGRMAFGVLLPGRKAVRDNLGAIGPAGGANAPRPHLCELCDILARGLLQLRSRVADKTADRGERSVYVSAPQHVHANPTKRRGV